MNTIANTYKCKQCSHKLQPPRPLDTHINHNTKWSKLTYPPPPTIQILGTPPTTNLEWCLPLKKPTTIMLLHRWIIQPTQRNNLTLEREKASYGIYNPIKILKLPKDDRSSLPTWAKTN